MFSFCSHFLVGWQCMTLSVIVRMMSLARLNDRNMEKKVIVLPSCIEISNVFPLVDRLDGNNSKCAPSQTTKSIAQALGRDRMTKLNIHDKKEATEIKKNAPRAPPILYRFFRIPY